MSGTKEFDGTLVVPGASLRPQAPQIQRGRAPILIRQGELRGGGRKRKQCGGSMPALSYGKQAGKGSGCHRGLLGKGKKRSAVGSKGPPGAQDPVSALRLNNQPVPSASAEPVAYKGGGSKGKGKR